MGMVDWARNWNSKTQKHEIKPAFFNTDYKAINVATPRTESHCGCCGKKIVSGEVAIGKDSWTRHCLRCFPIFFEEIRKEFKRFEAVMKATEQDLITNKKKYETKNMLAMLK